MPGTETYSWSLNSKSNEKENSGLVRNSCTTNVLGCGRGSHFGKRLWRILYRTTANVDFQSLAPRTQALNHLIRSKDFPCFYHICKPTILSKEFSLGDNGIKSLTSHVPKG